MPTLYLSYKNEDCELAKSLTNELEALGNRVIYDALAITPGQNWRDVLLTALSGADAAVVLITDAALHSPFVMGEIGSARALNHSFGRMLLLPVIVGNMEIPTVVSDLFTVRMQTDQNSIREAAAKLTSAFDEYQHRRVLPRIFISHRHSDVEVVKALVGVLEAAFVIEQSNLRCTSVHPYRLRAGERTADRIRTELQNAESVIGIISPDAKASSYVLFELGASWGRAAITMPLLVHGATSADVPAPIGDLHTLSLSDETECYQLIDDLSDVVSLKRKTGQGSIIAQRVVDLVGQAK